VDRPAGYYTDDEHPGMVRWWDGGQWTDHRATNTWIAGFDDLRKDVRFVKGVVIFWLVLTLLGILLVILEGI
jgi:hypothetical protein